MKKILLYLITLTLFMFGCGLETKRLSEFYNGDINEVNQIKIVNGSTGSTVTITDENSIEKFLKDTKDIKFIPLKDQSGRDGFRYWVNLYIEDKETFSFGLSQIGDHYYSTDPDIYPIVNDFYLNHSAE